MHEEDPEEGTARRAISGRTDNTVFAVALCLRQILRRILADA